MKARLISFVWTMLPGPRKLLLHCRPVLFYFIVPASSMFLNATRRDRNLQPFTSKGTK